jgi:hypothetical protein
MTLEHPCELGWITLLVLEDDVAYSPIGEKAFRSSEDGLFVAFDVDLQECNGDAVKLVICAQQSHRSNPLWIGSPPLGDRQGRSADVALEDPRREQVSSSCRVRERRIVNRDGAKSSIPAPARDVPREDLEDLGMRLV